MIKNNKKGFTLLELLVVVLIIGILAAIALPQYKRAVEKAHAMEAVQTVKTVSDALHRYYLIHNKFPDEQANWGWTKELDIDMPKISSHFKYFRGSIYISMYKGDDQLNHLYMISKVIDLDHPWYKRGLTCNVGIGYENSFYAEICKDLCRVKNLTTVWGSGEKGCSIKF